jgi:predicted Zn-ribbon and HTH transcriptional regulator
MQNSAAIVSVPKKLWAHMKTIRHQIFDLLAGEEMNAKEISQAMGIREKEVYEHLPHIVRSLAAQKKRLIVQPFECLACGYVFDARKRFTRPGRCPRCKKSHIQNARYRIE